MRILCQNKLFRFIYDVGRFYCSPTEYYPKAQPALALCTLRFATQSLNCLLGVELKVIKTRVKQLYSLCMKSGNQEPLW